MKKSISFHFISFAFILALVGCGQDTSKTQSRQTSQATRTYTEDELDKLITPGMSIADITNRFGLPGSAIQVTEHIVLLTYSFPEAISPKQRLHLTGFGVDIKDGKVARWSPVTGESGKPQGLFGEQLFELFIVNGNLTNALNAFESEGGTKADSLKVSPQTIFKAKIFAGKSGSEGPGEKTVILVVNEEDAPKLQGLTEKHVGERTLLVHRGNVVAAPTITVPVTSRQFMFTVKGSQFLDNFKEQ